MENINTEITGSTVTNETALPPFVLITLDEEKGTATLSHSKILDNDYICDILRSALEQVEYKLSLEEDTPYTEH